MKNDARPYVWPTIEVLIAVIVGAVSSIWADGAVDFLIGIATFLALELVRFNVMATRIHDQYQRVALFVDALKSQDSVGDLVLLYGFRGRLAKAAVDVGRDDVWNLWRDSMARANARWSVVTYAAATDTWLLAWRRQALAIQKERLMNECKIERVFVVDSPEEWERLGDVVREQREAGISVWWVVKEKIVGHALATSACTRLGTLDVAVIDDSWVYRTYLDSGRALVGASVSRDSAIVEAARVFVREVRGLATVASDVGVQAPTTRP